MERKRKLPARAGRAEGPSKKRTSTPPDQQTQSPAPAVPPPVIEEPLPKSIASGKPLPTVNEPQPENLPSSHFQSIPERYYSISLALEPSANTSTAEFYQNL